MSRSLVTFDNFSGGEYGLQGGVHAPPHTFTGTNVVRFQDGSLGPRSGLVDLAITGTANGAVLGFGYNSAQNRCWYIQSTSVRDFASDTTGGAVRTMGTTLASVPTARVRSVNAENDVQTFLTSYGDKEYYLDHNAGTLTAVAAGAGGRAIGVYNDRLLIAGPSANTNRLYYSAAADFTTWPVANYLDVGYGYAIVAVAAHRDRVTIMKSDGTWWILTGVPGVNDVLRRMLRSMRPGSATNGMTRWGITGDGQVWLLPEWGEYPTSFSGANLNAIEYLSFKATPGDRYDDESTLPKVGVTGLTKPADLFMTTGQSNTSAYDNQGLLFTQATWTKHAFSKNISGYIDGRFDIERRVLLCDGGAVGSAPKFYAWQYNLNRPPFSGKTWENIGDASASTALSASFTVPEWSAKDGSEIQIQAVAVDFKKWNHGYSVNNGFTVSLTPVHHDGGSAEVAGGNATAVPVGTFDESPSVASTSGTADRRRWTVPTAYQFANGFQVAVSGLVGCAIQKIHVFYDIRPTQAV